VVVHQRVGAVDEEKVDPVEPHEAQGMVDRGEDMARVVS
jgi:hypothetical protein